MSNWHAGGHASQIINDASRILQQQGSAVKQHLTGSLGGGPDFGPGDLVFQPNSRPGVVYVIEFKFVLTSFLPDYTGFEAIRNLNQLRMVNRNTDIRPALATNATVFGATKTFCMQNGVMLFESVHSGSALARAVMDWVRSA